METLIQLLAMSSFQNLLDSAPAIEKKLGYAFQNRPLLALALVHRSYVNESPEPISHNERLEFLGDSVLGMIIAEHLYKNFPNIPEGDLSYLRSRLVEASSCVCYAQKLNVSSYLLLGRGERLSGGFHRDSILADLFEALIGAIYLDGGLEAARNFLFSNFASEIADILEKPVRNWKALLQDYCQKNLQITPSYRVIEEHGPDHSKLFTVAVYVKDEPWGYGKGNSKKEAQQAAAAEALTLCNKNFDSPVL